MGSLYHEQNETWHLTKVYFHSCVRAFLSLLLHQLSRYVCYLDMEAINVNFENVNSLFTQLKQAIVRQQKQNKTELPSRPSGERNLQNTSRGRWLQHLFYSLVGEKKQKKTFSWRCIIIQIYNTDILQTHLAEFSAKGAFFVSIARIKLWESNLKNEAVFVGQNNLPEWKNSLEKSHNDWLFIVYQILQKGGRVMTFWYSASRNPGLLLHVYDVTRTQDLRFMKSGFVWKKSGESSENSVGKLSQLFLSNSALN